MTTPSPTVRMTRPTYGRTAPLPHRTRPWLRNSALLLATATGVPVAAPLLGMDRWVTSAATTALVLAAAAAAVEGHRWQTRHQDTDRCAEQLCAAMGMPATRAVLWAHTWRARGREPGRPSRLVVRYTNAGLALDPEWLTRITEIVSGQPWGTYRLERHNRRRCRLSFILDESLAALPDPEPVARAKRLVLRILGPTATVTGTDLDPAGAVIRLTARHDDGARFAPSGYRARVERTVSAVLPGRWRARWDLESDEVVFEQRPAFPTVIWHDTVPDPGTDYEDVAIAFARDEDGRALRWRPVIDPHMILIGATGTGKTAAVHTVVTAAALLDWMVWVVDGKGTEFLGFRDWPNIQVVASRTEHQAAVIHRAWQEMELRYQAIEDGADEADFVPLLVVVDEFADFKANLEAWYSLIRVKGDPSQPRTLLEIASLVRKGRSARIHLLVSTQRPDADFFGGRGRGDTRDSLRMRVSLGPLSPQGAIMLWNNPATGTSIPRGLRGRATAVTESGEVVEVQCFYTPDPRRTPTTSPGHAVLQRLRPAHPVHDRLVLLDPDNETATAEPGTDAAPQPRQRAAVSTFRKTVEARWGRAADYPDHDPVRRREQLAAARADGAPDAPLLGLQHFLAQPGGDTPDSQPPDSPPAAPPRRSMSDLLDAAAAATSRRAPLRLVPDLADTAPDAEDHDIPGVGDWPDTYDDAEPSAPMDVEIGDLIFLEDLDDWAVVTGEPGPDLLAAEDAGLIAITYRTDDDSEHQIVVPEDGEVLVRRPLESA
ncbi:FtsK/SpoIIIE domain-containing protein [Nocardia sp. IFM 10818]